jgi:type II secretory pathway pseudopilin PulG
MRNTRIGHRRGGFTLVEATLATIVVAMMAATALTTVRLSVRSQYKSSERAMGGLLASGLMAEIMAQAYQDPTLPTTVLGPEAGESTTSRAGWDDVDDYNGWSESPLQNKDGTTISNTTGWQRSVVVAWVSSGNPTITSTVETGCKRITVTVKHNGVVVGTRVCLKGNAP